MNNSGKAAVDVGRKDNNLADAKKEARNLCVCTGQPAEEGHEMLYTCERNPCCNSVHRTLDIREHQPVDTSQMRLARVGSVVNTDRTVPVDRVQGNDYSSDD